MRTATAIYHAPEGDAKSCTMNGVIFNDGETVDLNSNEHAHIMSKLQNSPHFEFKEGDDDGEGESDNLNRRDFKAGIEGARDHSFEDDQRSQQAARAARAAAAVPRKPGRPSNAERAARAQAEEPKQAEPAEAEEVTQ